MKYALKSGLVLLGALSGLYGCGTAELASDGSVSLFDGQTLDGWRVSEENPGSFTVQDGQIVAHGPRAHLFYDGPAGTDFTDFELSLETKTEPNANSGVFFHTQYQAESWPIHGLEAQINATQSDARKTGSLYAVADVCVIPDGETEASMGLESCLLRQTPPHLDGQWTPYVIRVKDGTVTTRIGEQELAKWTQPDDWDDPTRRLDAGTFALQAHDPDSIVYFRNMRVTRLD